MTHLAKTLALTVGIALLLGTFLATPSAAQIPDEFTNLQQLPRTLEKPALVNIMRTWTSALGVRCNHCHVGPDNLVGADFASDEKATKKAARQMLVMTRSINQQHLANLPTAAEGDQRQVASCYTCHRGQPKPPVNIRVEVTKIAAQENVDTALDHFRSRRAEHYGTGRYDFSPSSVFRLAQRLLETGQTAEAKKTLEMGLEFDPRSADLHAALGAANIQAGDPAAGRASLGRALEIDPENDLALALLDRISK